MCGKLQSAKIKKTTLRAELVEISSSILVENIECSDDDAEDFLSLYFNDVRKSGGTDVKDVHIIENGRAIVTFTDPKGMYYNVRSK